MFKTVFLFSAFLVSSYTFSQIPTNCFEIESILVDGCDGSNEGKNEMVIFQNGPSALNVSDLRIDGAGANGTIQTGKWPNTSNDFLGFCTDATATANLAILNQGITQCGFLKEPENGVIPVGVRVLIMTSTEYTPIPTYFQNLSDTMYVIFQCAGNTGGHFANFGTPASERTLVLVNTATSCSDQVVYDRSLLELPDGTVGAEDGGSVGYNWNGDADYFNNGCQAPLVPSSVTFDVPAQVCPGEAAEIIAEISGSYSTLVWSGGSGTFSSTANDTINYTPAGSEAGLITLNLKAFDPCGNLKIDEDVSFTVQSAGLINIIANEPNPVCIGDTVTLTASGGTTYTWSSGETTSSVVVIPASDDTLTVNSLVNGCPASAEYIVVVVDCSVIIPDTVVISVSFPNIFTPNGDSENDVYSPVAFSGVTNEDFTILNRWGNIVYQSKDQVLKWDGTANGNEASEGVYFYICTYRESGATESKTVQGFIQLKRK